MNTDKTLVKGLYILTGVCIAILPKFLFPILTLHVHSERQSEAVEIPENVEDESTRNVADGTIEWLEREIKIGQIITVEESERQMREVKSLPCLENVLIWIWQHHQPNIFSVIFLLYLWDRLIICLKIMINRVQVLIDPPRTLVYFRWFQRRLPPMTFFSTSFWSGAWSWFLDTWLHSVTRLWTLLLRSKYLETIWLVRFQLVDKDQCVRALIYQQLVWI